MAKTEDILIITESACGSLSKSALEMFSAAQSLNAGGGYSISCVIIGSEGGSLASEAFRYGANQVFAIKETLSDIYKDNALLDALEDAIAKTSPRLILSGSSQKLKEVASSLAVRLGCTIMPDCISLKACGSAIICEKNIYGGNAQAVFRCEASPLVATLLPNTFTEKAKESAEEGSLTEIALKSTAKSDACVKILKTSSKTSSKTLLSEAPVVVGGGRGIGSKEGFDMLGKLASILNGAVGATRPPCDNEWADESLQIGVSGKCISPNVYFAVGISGSKLHTQGLKGSKAIIAINTDKDAPIFKIADYGIVGDWQKIIPALIDKAGNK